MQQIVCSNHADHSQTHCRKKYLDESIKSFFAASNLFLLDRVQFEEKLYGSKKSDKYFAQSLRLSMDQEKLTGEKPFKCHCNVQN